MTDCRDGEKWLLRRLPTYSDDRGTLVALESGGVVHFPIERVYFLFGTPEASNRGLHAHRLIEQIAIAVSGACTFVLDDATNQEEIRMDKPETALFMAPMVWHEMKDFSPDCVLLVLASGPYDEAEYIRDYDQFRRAVESAQIS